MGVIYSDNCSSEYLKEYVCDEDEKRLYDTDYCYPGSAVVAPSCVGGFFQINNNKTMRFWNRTADKQNVRCCPGASHYIYPIMHHIIPTSQVYEHYQMHGCRNIKMTK
jgi:hypothetical protein